MTNFLIKLFNSIMNPRPSNRNNEDLMRYFRAEYKTDYKGAYDHWMSTNKTNYYN